MSTDSEPSDEDLIALIKAITCPDCACKILRGLTTSGEAVIVVAHDATCPQIPPEEKAQGNTAMRFPAPQSFTVDMGDDQHR